jgi:ubiquinone/menaquinone biosynthesis C-methylase UbiE
MVHARGETAVHSVHTGFAHPERNVTAFSIEPGMKVADFGAGSGAYTLAIAERLSGSGTVYAVDIQKDLLRRIKNEANHRRLHGVEVVWGDLDRPGHSKIANHSLDLVLMSNLLFQLHDRDAAFKEARRVLKRTGRLVVIDWNESYGGLGPTREHVCDRTTAIAHARTAGFGLHKEFEAGAHHYGLIFVVPHAERPRKVLVQ